MVTNGSLVQTHYLMSRLMDNGTADGNCASQIIPIITWFCHAKRHSKASIHCHELSTVSHRNNNVYQTWDSYQNSASFLCGGGSHIGQGIVLIDF